MPSNKPTGNIGEGQPADRGWIVQGYMLWRSGRPFTPPTDIIELADRIAVMVEIAGMRASDFNIMLVNNQLVISGFRERPKFENTVHHQLEIGFGEFRIEVLLPWLVAQEAVTATYREGFLQVDLPRQAPERVHVVDVNVEKQDENL